MNIAIKAFIANQTITRYSFNHVQSITELDSQTIKRQHAGVIFIFDTLSGLINYPKLLKQIGFRTISHYIRNRDLFAILFYKKN